jgi:hypothetical protein
MTIKSTAALLADYTQALTWMERWGATTNEGRLAAYRELLADAAAARDQGARITDWPADRLRSLFAAICEAFDVVEIATLRDDTIRGKQDKLREIANGSTYYDQVAPHEQDQGRDATFELLTAAKLQRAGADVALERPSDVAATRNGFAAMIECKRPKTDAGFGRSLVGASRQFAGHRAAGNLQCAIVAIDFTRLINPDLAILPAADRNTAMDALHGAVQRKLEGLRQITADACMNAHEGADIDGIMIRATAMTINELENRPEVATALRIFPQGRRGDERFTRTLQFSALMAAPNGPAEIVEQ